jgi:hypothetical protein
MDRRLTMRKVAEAVIEGTMHAEAGGADKAEKAADEADGDGVGQAAETKPTGQ